MTVHQGTAFALVIVTMAAFAWGRLRYDLIALIALVAGLGLGVVPLRSAFDGFKDDVVVIIASALVVSSAIARSGIIAAAAQPVLEKLRGEGVQAPVLAAVTCVLSMATKNVGALAIMTPIALRLSQRSGTAPSRLLMPMSFASLAGGLVTLVGTSTNVIVSQIRFEESGAPFAMFDFAPVGLGVSAVVCLYMVFAWRRLPVRKSASAESAPPRAYVVDVKLPEGWQGAKAETVGALQALANDRVRPTMLVRGRRRRPRPGPEVKLRAGDHLGLEGEQEVLERLIADCGLELIPAERRLAGEDPKEEVRVVEAVVEPASPLVGASASSIGLHRNFGVNLLGVARSGGRIRDQVRSAALRAGDVLVLQAAERTLPSALSDLGARPLADVEPRLGIVRRGVPAVLILAAAVAVCGLGLAPVSIAFFTAAVAVVAIGAISMRQVYESLDGQVLVLIAALIPVSEAISRTGGGAAVATFAAHALVSVPPLVALGAVMATAMIFSPFLHNAPTVLVLGPIAVSLARALHLSADGFLMATAVGAGCDFLTPVGHQCNTLVMAPGGYRFGDYARLGAPLAILVLLLATPLIALVWPLR
ncbi:MAG: SLC13 family permease [Caulobacteraceae bacterium]